MNRVSCQALAIDLSDGRVLNVRPLSWFYPIDSRAHTPLMWSPTALNLNAPRLPTQVPKPVLDMGPETFRLLNERREVVRVRVELADTLFVVIEFHHPIRESLRREQE